MSAVTNEEKAREIVACWYGAAMGTRAAPHDLDTLTTAIAKALADRPVEDGERQRLRSLAKALHETVLLHANDRDKALAERDSLRAQCDALREAAKVAVAEIDSADRGNGAWEYLVERAEAARDILKAALITATEKENVQEKK